jgi:DnaK suppressor protein
MGGQAGRQFKSLLGIERRRLLRELQAISRRAALIDEVPRASAAQGDDESLADAASQTLERDRDSAVEASLRAVLAEVEEALARIRRGTYGVCVRCQRPIAVQRLQAIPYATLCIACKQDEEQHRGRGAQAPFREWRVLKTPREWDDEETAEPGEERRRRGRRDVAA